MTQRKAHRFAALLPLVALLFVWFGSTAQGAVRIERIVTPGGIEAWLVSEPSVPVIAVDFAFVGGANADPASRPGVGNMVSSLLDEGAGDLDSRAFQQALQELAVHISFNATRDHFRGSLRTLSHNRDRAFDLLKLALTAPRFDDDAVERIRGQILANLRRQTTNPNDIASRRWWQAAFPSHPYGRPVDGTLESVPQIAVADLKAYMGQVFARGTLKVAIVGDIDAESAKRLLDSTFGILPAQSELKPVPDAKPHNLGQRVLVDLDVPQTVLSFGGLGVARKDPDFFAAYIVNHVLGGGPFSSRLYREVREKRGLAYSVHTSLYWLEYAALFVGGTATRADRAGESLQIIEQEIKRLAERGPSAEELEKAKSYLKGSYALGFDTSSKISGQLLQIQLDDLGIDYINKRSAMIDAVTPDDAKRVARRLLDGELLVTIVGRTKGFYTNGG